MTRFSPLLLVFVLWGAGLGAAAQFGKMSVTFDLVATTYSSAGPTALGLLVSIVGFPGLIFGTTAGIFVEGLGYRRVLVGALLSGAGLSALESLMLPLPLMLALRVGEGMAHLAIVVAAPVLIAQIAPANRQGLAMTLWSSFFGVAYSLLALFGRPLALAFGEPALFLAHAAYLALIAGLLLWLLPRDLPRPRLRLSPAALLRQHAEIYASPYVAAPAFGFVCYTISYVAVLTLLPPMAGGWVQVILATGMPLVSIAVSLTLGVWMLGQMPAVRAAMAGFALALLAALVLGLGWGQPVVTIAASLVLAGALGLVQGASFSAIPQLNPQIGDRARAAGAVAQMGNLGTTVGTPLLSAIIAASGSLGVAAFVALFSILGIVLHLWQARRRQAFSMAPPPACQ